MQASAVIRLQGQRVVIEEFEFCGVMVRTCSRVPWRRAATPDTRAAGLRLAVGVEGNGGAMGVPQGFVGENGGVSSQWGEESGGRTGEQAFEHDSGQSTSTPVEAPMNTFDAVMRRGAALATASRLWVETPRWKAKLFTLRMEALGVQWRSVEGLARR